MSLSDRITSMPALILTGLTVASGLFARSFDLTSAEGIHLTQAKLMLEEVTDTRFLSNVILVAWLVAVVIRAPGDAAPDRLIRHGSYCRALAAACRDGMTWAIAILPLLLLGMYVTTLGLPAADDGRQGISGYSTEQQTPGWPWLSVMLTTIALALALLVATQLIALALHIVGPVRGLDVGFATAFGVLALVSSAGFIDAGSPLNLSSLTTVVIAAAAPHDAMTSWTVVLGACAAMLLAVRAKDRAHRHLHPVLGRRVA